MTEEPFDPRLLISSADEVALHRGRFTHLVSIANPGKSHPRPAWFQGPHLQLWFGDVTSEADAMAWHTRAPAAEDVRSGLEFFRAAMSSTGSRVLVHCNHGASRSPALAYVFVADLLGAGREEEVLAQILKIRPNAVPNRLVAQLGDDLLGRQGALLRPLVELYRLLDKELYG